MELNKIRGIKWIKVVSKTKSKAQPVACCNSWVPQVSNVTELAKNTFCIYFSQEAGASHSSYSASQNEFFIVSAA